ncbi:MAG: hypothetical protein ACFE95_00180 [Candidatus Hodarchaeota archaeon]
MNRKEGIQSEDDSEKPSLLDLDSPLGKVFLNVASFMGIFFIVMIVYNFFVMIFLFLFVSQGIFNSLGITNWRVFGIYYEMSDEGGSFGYNLLTFDALFLGFLVTLGIWLIWYNQINEKILDMIEKQSRKEENS